MTARASEYTQREKRGRTAKSDPRPRRTHRTPATPTPPREAGKAATSRKQSDAAARPVARASAPAHPRAPRTSRSMPARAPLPPVAPCDDLEALRALDPVAARDHVDAMLHATMPAALADAFEARGYRWELHLVPLDQLRLLRAVDLVPSRVRRYRAALRRGASCAPLIGLGGEGRSPAEDVLLCDGYHRAVALRDAGVHFAWVWLAAGAWKDTAVAETVA